jgi:hypothetical protein
MTHPSASELALFSGGDLSLAERWRVRLHVRSCDRCRAEAEAFAIASADLIEDAANLPAGLKWDRLAAEMTANIHVGLEAAQCVTPARRGGFHPVWRAAALVTAMSLIVVTAWFLNPVPPPVRHAMRGAPGIELRNTATGLELNENGAALVILHGRGVQMQRPIISSHPGALRARVVDGETGQITINHVYSD